MRFLMLPIQKTDAPAAPPGPELYAEMQKLVDSETKAGRLVMTGGLAPVSKGGAAVKSAKGKVTVLDGPFTEAKEVAGGFAIIEVSSREEAIEASRRFFKIIGDGEAEIHQIF
jgi:hypothetical protein